MNLPKILIFFLITGDHFYVPQGTTLNATSLKFKVVDPSLPATSGFGTFESFKLIVWGDGLTETVFTGNIDIYSTSELLLEMM